MATTHWNAVSDRPVVGQAREQELRREFWAETLTHGACYKRIQTPQHARDTVEYMLTQQLEAVSTKIQEELVDREMRVAQTEAGRRLIDTVQGRLRDPLLL
jgi:urease accessory protein UreF